MNPILSTISSLGCILIYPLELDMPRQLNVTCGLVAPLALSAAEVARGLTRLEKLTPVLLHCCGDRSAGH